MKRDRKYLAFVASQPCCVTGEWPVTVHHVRFCGSPRDDRRTIPLVARLHMRTHETPGEPCVERGKKIFEQRWGVNLEAEIQKLNWAYEQKNTPRPKAGGTEKARKLAP